VEPKGKSRTSGTSETSNILAGWPECGRYAPGAHLWPSPNHWQPNIPALSKTGTDNDRHYHQQWVMSSSCNRLGRSTACVLQTDSLWPNIARSQEEYLPMRLQRNLHNKHFEGNTIRSAVITLWQFLCKSYTITFITDSSDKLAWSQGKYALNHQLGRWEASKGPQHWTSICRIAEFVSHSLTSPYSSSALHQCCRALCYLPCRHDANFSQYHSAACTKLS